VLTSETASAPASSAAFAIALSRPVQAAPERDATFLDVRAGDVQLKRGDPLDVGQNSRQLDVFLQCRPADIDNHHGAARAKLGHLFSDETAYADALEPDRVKHAGGRFDDARRRMPFALGQEQSFDGDPAER
jgi:hypothetical protein